MHMIGFDGLKDRPSQTSFFFRFLEKNVMRDLNEVGGIYMEDKVTYIKGKSPCLDQMIKNLEAKCEAFFNPRLPLALEWHLSALILW